VESSSIPRITEYGLADPYPAVHHGIGQAKDIAVKVLSSGVVEYTTDHRVRAGGPLDV